MTPSAKRCKPSAKRCKHTLAAKQWYGSKLFWHAQTMVGMRKAKTSWHLYSYV
jgi:hypothetical protein